MTDTTLRVYTLQGSSLQTYRWNFGSLSGLHSLPPRRGSGVEVPYKHGSFSFPRKFYGEKQFSLKATILPQDENGDVTLATPWHHLYQNLDDFMALMHSTTHLTLRRTMPDSSQREIFVEVLEGFEVNTTNQDRLYEVEVPVVASDPFWRETPQNTHGPERGSASKAFQVLVGGNAPVNDMIITIDCVTAGENPSLTLSTWGDKILVRDSFSSSDQIVLDIKNRKFLVDSVRWDHAIEYNRAWFMEFQPDVGADLVFASDSGSWDVTVDWYNKWF